MTTNDSIHDHDLLVTSGIGPVESRRFVSQLAARLEHLAEAAGLVVRDVVTSGAAGDASRLFDELGTHVLVHRSAQRSRRSRKRWFAAVSLYAAAPEAAAVELARDDLEITACRAGGPGGQHVN